MICGGYTFGDAAAWSLQGQKTVTGGEGGILLTDNKEIYTRALLLGHYNKRCKQEIEQNHPLHEYFLTGFGLKLRAHPLAIAMAEQQFEHLDEWLQQRAEFANYMINELSKYECLSMPDKTSRKPSWYAFVMRYQAEAANGLSLDRLYQAMLEEGLVELDRPNSTRPLHDLPIFKNPERIFPHFYTAGSDSNSKAEFPIAMSFATSALKLPVWSQKSDWPMVQAYVGGTKKVLDNLRFLM